MDDLIISTSQVQLERSTEHSRRRVASQAVHTDGNPSLALAATPAHVDDHYLSFQCSPPDMRPHIPGKDINVRRQHYIKAPRQNNEPTQDPIHPGLHLPSSVMRFIDTPYFQRLRYLKQLGCTYFVYPGAQHTRLEHSMGVAYMAFQWASRVLNNYGNEADVEPRDVHLLMLAGALHDIGHGPFSHMFEQHLHDMGLEDWCVEVL